MQMLVNSKDLQKVVGISKSTAYRLMKRNPDFPKPIKLSATKTLWNTQKIIEWLEKNYSQKDN